MHTPSGAALGDLDSLAFGHQPDQLRISTAGGAACRYHRGAASILAPPERAIWAAVADPPAPALFPVLSGRNHLNGSSGPPGEPQGAALRQQLQRRSGGRCAAALQESSGGNEAPSKKTLADDATIEEVTGQQKQWAEERAAPSAAPGSEKPGEKVDIPEVSAAVASPPSTMP